MIAHYLQQVVHPIPLYCTPAIFLVYLGLTLSHWNVASKKSVRFSKLPTSGLVCNIKSRIIWNPQVKSYPTIRIQHYTPTSLHPNRTHPSAPSTVPTPRLSTSVRTVVNTSYRQIFHERGERSQWTTQLILTDIVHVGTVFNHFRQYSNKEPPGFPIRACAHFGTDQTQMKSTTEVTDKVHEAK